ncbi:MAG: amino acid ABC transporter ATP-binding protein, partial [Gammaproteobacteria bacterium]
MGSASNREAGPPPAIRAESLGKRFGDLEVLHDVDLCVYRGEVVCILGPSGSGKSTLLRCLNWLSPPSSGRVWIGEERVGVRESSAGELAPLPNARLRAQRSRIGMVFQVFNLWPHRTALGNVMEGLVTVRRLPRREAGARAMALLQRVGLADKADVYPAKLSGGQQQR